MQYVTIAYGNGNKWRPLAERWLEKFKEATDDPLVVVSDGAPWVAEVFGEDNTWSFEDLPKIHGNLNTSGILLAHAAIQFAPCLVVTLDVDMQHAPLPGDWMKADIALGLDPIKRTYPDIGVDLEYNCAVQWCGQSYIGRRFLFEWERLYDHAKASRISYWEQVVWSKVWWEIKRGVGTAELYPKELNWSHMWGRNKDASLVHYHGGSKWRTLK